MKNSLSVIIESLKEVLSSKKYQFLSLIVFTVILLFSIWFPNFFLIKHVIFSPDMTFIQKLKLIISLLGSLQTNFSLTSRTLTIMISLLFGLNVSMSVFYFRRRMVIKKSSGMSIGGTLIGLLGISCASCGSVILSSIFGIGATAGFIGTLPLKGQEFGLLSIGILGFSIFLAAKEIQNPIRCNKY